jgi:hypothetical protein
MGKIFRKAIVEAIQVIRTMWYYYHQIASLFTNFFSFLFSVTYFFCVKMLENVIPHCLQACSERAKFVPGRTEEDLFLWAENGFKLENGKSLLGQLDEPKGK